MSCRVLTVYLNCDLGAKTPKITTDGDSQTTLHYISQKLIIVEFSRLSTIIKVMNITYYQWCTPGGCEQLLK